MLKLKQRLAVLTQYYIFSHATSIYIISTQHSPVKLENEKFSTLGNLPFKHRECTKIFLGLPLMVEPEEVPKTLVLNSL
jgi:hypothetical protein